MGSKGEILGRFIILVDSIVSGGVQRAARGKLSIPVAKIQHDQWYNNEATFNAYLNGLAKKLFGGKRGLQKVGRKILPTIHAITPEQLEGIPDAITAVKMLDALFHQNNRGDDIGGDWIEDETPTSLTFKDNSHHNTHFVHGIIEGIFDVLTTHKLTKSKVVQLKEDGKDCSIIKLEFV
ncbi:hypothetical protein K8R78_02215 [bacterium]|nr:hypothetical protein [bacterium]